jgi:hypothetical protein
MKLLDGIVNYFRNPKHRDVYAVASGEYAGEFLVYMEEIDDNFRFLSLPDMTVRTVPKHDVYSGIETNILNKVEKLPRDVHFVCCEQYKACSETPRSDGNVPINTLSNT